MIIKETEEEYNLGRRKDWISPSDIKDIKTPLEFFWNKKFGTFEHKTYFDVGTALHVSVLEPKKFNNEVTYFPDRQFPTQDKINKDGSISLAAKGNGKAWTDFQNENPSKVVLRQRDWNHIVAMRKSIMEYPGTKKLLQLNKGYVEYSFYSKHIWNKDGSFDRIEAADKNEKRDSPLIMLVRTKADFVHKMREFCMDVKTTVDASPQEFSKSCANLEYDIQGAMVCNIVSANISKFMDTFVTVVVEKKPPYQAVIYNLLGQDLMDAMTVYLRRLNAIRESMNKNEFKGYEFLSDNEYGMLNLKLPTWYKYGQSKSKF